MCIHRCCGFFGIGIGRFPHAMPFPNGCCNRCDDDPCGCGR